MKINYSQFLTPITSDDWKKKSDSERKKIIKREISKFKDFENLEISKVPDNGQVVFTIIKNIPVEKRGLLLLNLESKLKENVDKGITVWCEAEEDKSKLRNLRGIKIKV
jgi:hypothetical protein